MQTKGNYFEAVVRAFDKVSGYYLAEDFHLHVCYLSGSFADCSFLFDEQVSLFLRSDERLQKGQTFGCLMLNLDSFVSCSLRVSFSVVPTRTGQLETVFPRHPLFPFSVLF